MATTEQTASTEPVTPPSDFGANEWLVEDMYERYKADPNSVDAAWHEFFADYRNSVTGPPNGRGGEQATSSKPAQSGTGTAETPTQAPDAGPAKADAKGSDTKAGGTKAADTKAGDTKADDTKAGDTKAGDTKADDTKSTGRHQEH